MANKSITVAYGDGIGPEIMKASLRILQAAGAKLDIETIEVGEKVYQKGLLTGIEPHAWESLRRTHVFLKAPLTTPQGGGFKSLNVTIRKSLGLYANVRPCVAYAPFVKTLHPGMDVVIVRENEEDLYAGIEHQQTQNVVQCLKLISRPGCERIIHYAFQYAQQHKRKKVTCFSKDNIMKQADGLFHRIYEEIGAQYPDIEKEHFIVDIGAAKLADTPQRFDVIVMENLYGDILSDVAAQIAGSVGLAGSSNIGQHAAMFEAIHGSAPSRAGQDKANPSGLLLAGVMMLVHIGQSDVAEAVHNAWLSTLEDGLHTYDIFTAEQSKQLLGTQAFASAVIDRLGRKPTTFKAVQYHADSPTAFGQFVPTLTTHLDKKLVGIDVFVDWKDSAEKLGNLLKQIPHPTLVLKAITNRGVKVWPEGMPETFCTDHWCCRFESIDAKHNAPQAMQLWSLLQHISQSGADVIKTENLYTFDGTPGYSLGQGE